MAIKTNTTKSIDKTSTALAEKVKKTAKDLKTLAARAGCGSDPIIEVEVPANGKDDVLYIGLNTVDFYFNRGSVEKMPLAVAEIAANTGNLGQLGKATVAKKRAELAAKMAAKTGKTEE